MKSYVNNDVFPVRPPPPPSPPPSRILAGHHFIRVGGRARVDDLAAVAHLCLGTPHPAARVPGRQPGIPPAESAHPAGRPASHLHHPPGEWARRIFLPDWAHVI